MRYLIAILALAGVVVSSLALQVHYDTGTEPCSINENWDCGIVNHSSYSPIIEHIPVAAIGIAGYLAAGRSCPCCAGASCSLLPRLSASDSLSISPTSRKTFFRSGVSTASSPRESLR